LVGTSLGLILLFGLITPNLLYANQDDGEDFKKKSKDNIPKNNKFKNQIQTSNDPTDSLSQTKNLEPNDVKKSAKLSTKLAGLFEKYQKGENVFQYITDKLLHQEDEVIRAVISIDDDSDEYLDELKSYGVQIEIKYQKLLQVKLPYSQLENIANIGFTNFIREPFLEIPDIVSEGPSVIDSDLVNNGGNTGQGIQVAVIDVGFDVTNSEISGNIVEAISFRGDGNILGDDISDTNHGTASAELVVDIAPDVDLYLYNVQTNLERIATLDFIINSRPNIDIITASLSSFSGPHDGTSDISLKMNEAKNAGFVVVNSAGNYANKHWQGQFLDLDTDNFHEFFGIDETIQITAFAGDPIFLVLTWDETWGSAAQDYELQLYDAALTLVDQSINAQFGTGDPQEFILVSAPSTGIYHVVIQKFSATQSVNFDLFSINHSFDEYNVPSSSIPPSADAAGAISVGATFWFDDQLEFFSSRGPTNDGRIKPDLSAPDGVTSSTLNPFFGTSASAPYVAGAAALTKFANPGASPSAIQSLLEQNTFSNHPKNNNDGTGRLDVSFLIGVIPPGPPPPETDVIIPLGSAIPGCEVTNECFIPPSLTIDEGDSVTWFNSDTAAHTVTSGDPGVGPDGVFDSGLLSPNATFSHTFTQSGTFPYFDLVHPWQIGEVIVNEDTPTVIQGQATGQVQILAGTCGLQFTNGSVLDYGQLSPNELSPEVSLNMTNSGSVPALLEIQGTDWKDTSNNSILDVNRTHFNVTSGQPFSSNTPLESFDQTVTNSLIPNVILNTFWQLEAILNQGFSGDVTQTMDFTVSC